MIECKSCGAYMKFDIPSQKLKCDHCRTELSVDEAEEIRSADASASGELNGITVNSFQCTQCGGQIFGDEHDMTGFCTFCGCPVELAGKLTKIERPQSIIPFRKTKAECKEIFLKTVKKDPYLPSGYKDEKHIDSFRGVYMPYYLYNVKYDGGMETTANGKSERQGDYVYTDKYQITGKLSGTYSGFEHDSSSAFNDRISEAIGPYPAAERVPFKAGYISGFYADCSDEKDSKYKGRASEAARNKLQKDVNTAVKAQNRDVSVNRNDFFDKSIVEITSEKTMYPVWFMSYRNDDRVAYAAVNGQTGKITADLPIDMKKFIIITLISMIPIFFILSFTAVFKPLTLLMIYTVLGCVTNCCLQLQSWQIMEHDGIDFPKLFKTQKDIEKEQWEPSLKEEDKQNLNFFKFILIIVAVFGVCFLLEVFLKSSIPILCFVFSCVLVGLIIHTNSTLKKHRIKLSGIPFAMLITAANLVTIVLNWVKPIYDAWYFGVCIFVLACVFALVLSMVKNQNFIATRKPIQFNKKGGDDRA